MLEPWALNTDFFVKAVTASAVFRSALPFKSATKSLLAGALNVAYERGLDKSAGHEHGHEEGVDWGEKRQGVFMMDTSFNAGS